MNPESSRDLGFWLVGIGASAGGMQALNSLIPGLSGKATYVIAQHMSASRPSLLREVLSRQAGLPVVELSDGMGVEVGVIYVTPPNCDVEVVGGRFRAHQAAKRVSPQPSVDILFESIAQEARTRSVGIVLSGTGSDGSVGIRAIHRAGGATLVQDPVSAAFPQMPQAAIATGVVDRVLLPGDIAEVLSGLTEGVSAQAQSDRWLPHSPMVALARQIREATGWDISDYKDGTLNRQIQRRIDALGLETIQNYVDVVRKDPDELANFRDSMLVGVTSFFRDPEAFDALDDLMRTAVEDKKAGDTVRGWVAGIATGEEAYTVAIILAEAARKRGGDIKVKVFATDLSERALETARAGIYPSESVAGLPGEIRERYFAEFDDTVQVVKSLRDIMVFAKHDVARDPPFLRMDLVSCRNVLIYLIPRAQKRVFGNLALALSSGGLLMLGSAESAPTGPGMFTVADAAARIYRLQPSATPRRFPRPMQPVVASPTFPGTAEKPSRDDLRDAMRDVLLEEFGPPSIVVDERGAIIRQFGDLTGILRLPQGDSDYSLVALVDPELRTEVTTVLTQTLRGADGGASHRAVLGKDGEARALRIRGRRFQPNSVGRPLVLLSFSTESQAADGLQEPEKSGGGDTSVRDADSSGPRLRAVTEALESSNEALQAMNEELQASSEELQASNEELQASNEELQAANEELSTVNDTLTLRTDDLTELNSVLENMQEALDFGLVLVDRHQRIIRFSPLAVRVFGLLPRDIGTPLGRVPRHVPIDDLESRVETVIESGKGEISEVTVARKTYLFQIVPYVVDGWVRGAVIALSDLSELSQARDQLRRQLEEYQSLSEAVPSMVYRTSLGMERFFYVSPSVTGLFGLSAEEALADADSIRSLIHPADAERVAKIQQIRSVSGSNCELDYRIVRKDGSERYVRDINRVVAGEPGTSGYRIGTVVDITDLHAALEEAERLRAHFEAIFANTDVPMGTLDAGGVFSDVNGPMATLLGVPRGQIVGRTLGGFVHDGDRALESALLDQAASNPGVGAHQLIRFVRPDGSVRYGQQRVVVLPAGEGRFGMQLVAITDLTDLEFATRAVRRHQRQLAGLFGNSPAPMVIIGTDGVFRQCNAAFCQLVGYREEELVGRACSEITHPDDVAEDLALIEELAQARRASFMLDKRFVTRAGSTVQVRKFSARVPSADEEKEEVIAQIMIDITGDPALNADRDGRILTDRDEEGQP